MMTRFSFQFDKILGKKTDLFALQVQDAISKYSVLQKRLCASCGTAQFMYREGNVTGGEANDLYPDIPLVYITSNEIAAYEKDPAMNRSVISGKDVVSQVISHCHEMKHVVQFQQAHSDNGDVYYGKRFLADKGNPYYYGKRPVRYYHNRSEQEAEYHGIVKGHEQLKEMFPNTTDEQREKAIVDYVNGKCFTKTGGHTDYYVMPAKPYKKLEQIKADFERAMSVSCEYGYDQPFERPKLQIDEFCRTMHITGHKTPEIKSPWRECVMTKLLDAKNEEQYLEVMDTVRLMNHPEDADRYACLKQELPKLRPEVMFGPNFLQEAAEFDRKNGFDSPYLQHVPEVKLHVTEQEDIPKPYEGPIVFEEPEILDIPDDDGIDGP